MSGKLHVAEAVKFFILTDDLKHKIYHVQASVSV